MRRGVETLAHDSSGGECMQGSKNPNPTPLEKVRRDAGMSRKKLSELSGVSFRSLECYEQRKNDLNIASIKTIKALANALGVPMEKIIDE
jgi:DNA-binding transcriptional regulator YiaG